MVCYDSVGDMKTMYCDYCNKNIANIALGSTNMCTNVIITIVKTIRCAAGLVWCMFIQSYSTALQCVAKYYICDVIDM